MKNLFRLFTVTALSLALGFISIMPAVAEEKIEDLRIKTLYESSDEVILEIPNQLVLDNPEEFGFLSLKEQPLITHRPDQNETQLLGPIISAVLVSVASKVIYSCVFLRGSSNACYNTYTFLTTRIIVNFNMDNKTTELLVSQEFYPGYIPGCEPRNSGPCNAGRWIVSFKKS